MRVVVLSIFLVLTGLVIGQVQFIKNPIDIGVVTAAGSDFVDVPIKNTGKSKIYIFRTDADKRFQIQYSSKTLLPDSTIYLRVLFTPEKKGTINEKLMVHFSHLSEPVALKVTGFCDEIPASDLIACPSFDQQQVNTSMEHDFTVMVIDADTRQPLEDASVSFIHNGLLVQQILTNRKGQHTQKLMLGYYYFLADHPDYVGNELGTYINRKNNLVVIPLNRRQQEEIAMETPPPSEVPEVPELPEEEIVEVIAQDTLKTEPLIESEDVVENDPFPNLPLRDYKPNNLVFLLDVSSSMNLAGKMDLLKASMIELTKILRPIDKITLVAYASSANVILETTAVNDIDTIIYTIQQLQPRGMTAGGKGMALAYEKATQAFIPEGNNQIIMATDGVFNMGEENVNKLAKKYSKKGVTVSVVGIKNRNIHKDSMEQLSEDGGGNYINIENYDQAQQSLINEIKGRSKIRP